MRKLAFHVLMYLDNSRLQRICHRNRATCDRKHRHSSKDTSNERKLPNDSEEDVAKFLVDWQVVWRRALFHKVLESTEHADDYTKTKKTSPPNPLKPEIEDVPTVSNMISTTNNANSRQIERKVQKDWEMIQDEATEPWETLDGEDMESGGWVMVCGRGTVGFTRTY